MHRNLWILIVCGALAGCTSPEATRRRGGGPGGDPNNRPSQVKMHEGSRQYFGTRVAIPSEGPALAPSEQARYLSLPSTTSTQTPGVGGGLDR